MMCKNNNRLTVWFLMVIPVFFFILFKGSQTSGSTGTERLYLEGIKAYQEEDYDRAAGLFLKVAETPVENGDLYYNLGNAFFKKGDLGRSVLWYERALKLIPSDPDLQFNHQFVTGRVLDKAENSSNPLSEVFLFWKHRMSRQDSEWAAILTFAAFTLISLVRVLKPARWLKYLERTVCVFAVVFILSACYDFYILRFERKAVVITDQVSVRSGLSDDATELFRLHQGTKVEVHEELRGYIKIRFSEDKIGWVEKKNLEII